jgi:hypothetical protein
MSNPVITFRLSAYHLARGLQIIRDLEPDYVLTSHSRIVKDLYIDYLAKMTINKESTVPQHLIDEVENNLYAPKSINSLKKFVNNMPEIQKKVKEPKVEKSIKSSVENFAPPTDWTE